MHRSSLILVSIATLACFITSWNPVRADIVLFDVQKSKTFVQTSNSQPVSPNSHAFYSQVIGSPGDFSSVTTTYAGAQSPLLYGVSGGTGTYIKFYASEPARDAEFTYPSTFQFQIAGGVLGTQVASINASSTALFSSSIPFFTGTTFTDLQGYNPSQNFTLTFASHSLQAGASQAQTFLDIYDRDSGNNLFHSVLSPSATSILLPSGTLTPGKNYRADLAFANRIVANNAGFVTATSLNDYVVFTSASFTSVPEPSSGFLLIVLGICSRLIYRSRLNINRSIGN